MAFEPGTPEYQSWLANEAAKSGAAPGFDIFGMPLPGPAPAAPGPVAPPTGMTPTQASAKAIINAALAQFGLSALADWAWSTYLTVGNPEQVMLDLRARPEYRTRFGGMEALAKKGRAISEAQYIDLERTYAQLYRAAGLPPSFYDSPDDFAKLIANEIAPTELRDRISLATVAAAKAPKEVRDELSRLYGVSHGALTAYYLDPDRALPLLEQQLAAASIASTARISGFGPLSRTEAERLASLGLTEDAAAKGFGELTRSRELFGVLPGEVGTRIDRATQLGVLEGNAAAIERLNRRAEERRAAFGGGGGYASDREGVAGLATAST